MAWEILSQLSKEPNLLDRFQFKNESLKNWANRLITTKPDPFYESEGVRRQNVKMLFWDAVILWLKVYTCLAQSIIFWQSSLVVIRFLSLAVASYRSRKIIHWSQSLSHVWSFQRKLVFIQPNVAESKIHPEVCFLHFVKIFASSRKTEEFFLHFLLPAKQCQLNFYWAKS